MADCVERSSRRVEAEIGGEVAEIGAVGIKRRIVENGEKGREQDREKESEVVANTRSGLSRESALWRRATQSASRSSPSFLPLLSSS